jgi:hypothetical protein
MVNGVCTPPKPSCTGGTESEVGNYKVHKFTTVGNSETLSCTSGGNIDYLVVGGGGGGGGLGGGGGAGGFIEGSTLITNGNYTVVVGAGGLGDYNWNDYGTSGGISSFKGLTADGGGKGYHHLPGGNGASGGGGGYGNNGGTGITGQGNRGGKAASIGNGGGGGGGADGVGGDGSSNAGGNAGPGKTSSITGVLSYYAVGGPGVAYVGYTAQYPGSPATGGSAVNQNAVANTGNGGPSSTTYYAGKNGGSGVVIVRYAK